MKPDAHVKAGANTVAAYLRYAVGLVPVPEDPVTLAGFVRWAQGEHILGQVEPVLKGIGDARLRTVLENAAIRSAHDRRMLAFETSRIERALMGQDINPILLKGSAYVAEELIAGVGRRVSDIDILVNHEDLETVETLLREAGWRDEVTTANRYDQKYYRKWMHELPPLRHATRRTLVDVHHRLLPRTSRINPDHKAMMRDAVSSSGSALMVFAPVDRFIHSAIHIFADGQLDTPARSLIELYYLYQDLSDDEKARLHDRAMQVQALPPVLIALWSLKQYFDVTVSNDNINKNNLLKYFIKVVIEKKGLFKVAQAALYVRSHYLRMPLSLLVRHLFMKLIRRA